MGVHADGADSLAIQVQPRTHWPDMHALILVASDAKKTVSSTSGMQTTVETSPLFQHRVQYVVADRMRAMEEAIGARDFAAFGRITMQDSNQFHAVCLDTYPPITYLNDVSKQVMQLVTAFNDAVGEIKAAYTFDAGPNAVVYVRERDLPEFMALVMRVLPAEELPEFSNATLEEAYTTRMNALTTPALTMLADRLPVFAVGGLRKIIHTRVGDGPRVVAPEETLLNADGFPRVTG
jgi:diphosphomevalonate decarboxylase